MIRNNITGDRLLHHGQRAGERRRKHLRNNKDNVIKCICSTSNDVIHSFRKQKHDLGRGYVKCKAELQELLSSDLKMASLDTTLCQTQVMDLRFVPLSICIILQLISFKAPEAQNDPPADTASLARPEGR